MKTIEEIMDFIARRVDNTSPETLAEIRDAILTYAEDHYMSGKSDAEILQTARGSYVGDTAVPVGVIT